TDIDAITTPTNYNIALVIDVSSSMDNKLNDGTSRLDATIAAAKNLISQYEQYTNDNGGQINLNIIAFNGVVQKTLDLSAKDFHDHNKVAELLKDVSALSQYKGYATNYEAALIKTEQWLKAQDAKGFQDYNDKVLFLTDGQPTISMMDGKIVKGDLAGCTFDVEALVANDSAQIKNAAGKVVGTIKKDGGYYKVVGGSNNILDAALTNTSDWADTVDAMNSLKNLTDDVHIIGLQLPSNVTIYKDHVYLDKNGNITDEYGKPLDGNSSQNRDPSQSLSTLDKGYISINNSNELLAALDKANQSIIDFIPETDLVYGNTGNDVIFGDGLAVDEMGVSSSKDILDDPFKFDISHDKVHLTLTGEGIDIDQPDQLLGGSGDDILYGQGGNDLLIGDGENTQSEKGMFSALGNKTANAIMTDIERGNIDKFAKIAETNEKDSDGNDLLFGGNGKDVLFGMGGDDYLNGGTGRDALFGGSGNDVFVFDKNDAVIHGGKGIDLVVANKSDGSLKDMLAGKTGPKVADIEVLLRAPGDASKLPVYNAAALLTFGIALGENSVRLDSNMWEAKDGVYVGIADTKAEGYTLETVAPNADYAGVQLVAPDQMLAEPQADAIAVQSLDELIEADADAQTDSPIALFSLNEADAMEDQASELAAAVQARVEASGSAAMRESESEERVEGSDADDAIIGTEGDDFIDGLGGSDTILAGAGNDIIVYDQSDYLIDGGSGIDFLITDAEAPNSLSDMLANWANNGENSDMPMVHDVEVMISGIKDTNSLSNMDEVAERYGIKLEKGENGDTLVLDKSKWTQTGQNGEGENATTTWTNGEGVTLETTLQETSSNSEQIVLAAQQVQSDTGGIA
ncbi:MAG: VWA domain-containing protein, partial [Desulfovibrio sp.]|nr:VWA domain-containing protein [Desulfovibrio sp.]